MPDSSRPHGLQPTRLLRPWDSPGKSTGVGCHCLLQQAALDFSFLLLGLICPPGGALGQVFNNTTALCRSSLCLEVPVRVRAKSLQSCPTLYDPLDCSPPGSSVHGILQTRKLEWVAVPSSSPSPHSVQSLSRVRIFATPRMAAHQVSLSISNSGELAQTPVHPVCDAIWVSSSVVPFSSCLQSSSASGSFPVS